MIEELMTGELPCDQRLQQWNEVTRRIIAPVEVEPSDRSTFNGNMQWVGFRSCDIICASSGPARIVGGEEPQTGILNLQIQTVGRSRHRNGKAFAELEEGGFILYDSSLPIYNEFSCYNQVLVLQLPIVAAAERLPRLREMAGVAMDGQSGPAALFSRFMRETWEQLCTSPGLWADNIDDLVWPLLDMAYASERVATKDVGVRVERRRALFAMIDENLCDPDLDVHAIANHIDVSVRYLQMLFAEMATTPTAFIQHRRLDLAAERLKREGEGCVITSLAYDVGFNDLSAFCRSFKRQFKVSPRDYRAGNRPGLPRESAARHLTRTSRHSDRN